MNSHLHSTLSSTTERQRDKLPLQESSSIMKVLVLLALFSVCNANILWPEQAKTNLDLVKDAFWDYVAKATETAEDSLDQIKQSQLGQEVNARITQSADTVNQYIVALRTQAAPLTQDFMNQFTQEAEKLKARLEAELTGLQPQVEDLVVKLQRQIDDLKREAAPYAEAMDPESVKAVLLQKTQELKAQMLPYTEEMQQKVERSLEDFQIKMLPMAQSFQAQLTQKTQEIQQSLAPYGEELKAKLDASAQDLQAQLTALWESFTRKTQ